MHDEAVSRRNFLRLGAAASVATAAMAVRPSLAFGQSADVPTFRLSPTGGGSSCRGGKGNGGCPSCNACRKHAENKVFRSNSAADRRRAHAGCRCTVVAGPNLSPPVFDAVFGGGDSADRRDPKVAELLDNGTIDGVGVPVMAATAPVLLLAGSAVGYLVWRRRHRDPVGADIDRGDWK